jgi:hypothetical protein
MYVTHRRGRKRLIIATCAWSPPHPGRFSVWCAAKGSSSRRPGPHLSCSPSCPSRPIRSRLFRFEKSGFAEQASQFSLSGSSDSGFGGSMPSNWSITSRILWVLVFCNCRSVNCMASRRTGALRPSRLAFRSLILTRCRGWLPRQSSGATCLCYLLMGRAIWI